MNTIPVKPTLYPVPWQQTGVHFRTSISGLTDGHEYDKVQKQTATLITVFLNIHGYMLAQTVQL